MKIGFITNESFPSGMATTNRILSLAIGLFELGNEVTIFCVRSTEKNNNIINKDVQGNHKGINFVYTNGTVIWPNSMIKKTINLLMGTWGFFLHINRLNKKKKFDAIICTTSNYFFNLLYVKYMNSLQISPLLAVDEYPYVVRNKQNYPNWFANFYLNRFYKFFSGLIIMTKPLIDFYRPLVNYGIPLIHIPMTVEPDRFTEVICKSPIEGDYIAYCGNLGQNQKDGIPILINAFGLIKSKFPNLKLVIIGSTKPSMQNKIFKRLNDLAKKNNVGNDIVFTGKIHRSEMPKYLCNAKVLTLARPDSIQAQGGFPTKLGEYLSTGKPVVVTAVGEIPDYLINENNAFLAEPGNEKSFAERLEFVLTNYAFAKEVGENGKKLALNIFNYKVQSSKLNHFIEEIIK